MRVWLLELTVGGEVFRRTDAEDAVAVVDAAGTTWVYEPGLSELAIPRPDAWDVQVGLTLEDDEAWYTLGADIEESPCTLRRWAAGELLEEAEVVAMGRARDVEWGEQGEGLSLTVAVAAVDSDFILSPQARIDAQTFPTGEILTAPYVPEASAGVPYLIPIGYPGHAPDLGGPYTVVPTMFCDVTNDTPVSDRSNRMFLSEGAITASTVAVADAKRGSYTVSDLDVATSDDLLGVLFSYTDFTADGTLKPTSPLGEQNFAFYVGYQNDATYGGGLVDPYDDDAGVLWGVGSIIRWVLRRTCSRLPVDFEDVERHRAWFNRYRIDSWVNDPDMRGLDWLESVVLTMAPHRWVMTPRGLSVRPWRWMATAEHAVAHLRAPADVERATSLRVANPGLRYNEITVRYRQMRARGVFRSSRVLTAQADTLSAAPGPSSDDRILGHALAWASQRRYGAVPLGVDLEHCWDDSTAAQRARDLLYEHAMPHTRVTYNAKGTAWEWLQVGDVVLLTDAEVGYSERVALVEGVTIGDSAGPSLELVVLHPLVVDTSDEGQSS